MSTDKRRMGAGPVPPIQVSIQADLADLSMTDRQRVLHRDRSSDPAVVNAVEATIQRVRNDGDSALIELAARYDQAILDRVEVPFAACNSALEDLDPDVRAALERAADAIGAFHRAQMPAAIECEPSPGIRLTRFAQPLDRVGVYAPGGRASYPSSVLMGVVPARVAGVDEIVLCSPPDSTGLPPATVLAACALAGVDRVFAAGGAGAIAAMAFGTESVPAVRRIVGPGNAWVNEAKRQVQGVVGIDCPAGPSEILVIADGSADPLTVAAELVAQAEHDPDASAVLLSTDRQLLVAVASDLARLVAGHEREAVIRSALSARGALLFAGLEAAVDFASEYAPEHLLLAVTSPVEIARTVRNAGTIFLGATSSVVFGDYMTGANHVLPTGGRARSFSGLDVLDFMRWTTTQQIAAAAAAGLAEPVARLAGAERLPGHAFAASLHVRSNGSRTVRSDTRTAVERTQSPLGRVAYSAIRTYDPGRSPVSIDLSDNTNLFGTCPAVRAVLTDLPDPVATRYPSVYADALREAAASHFGVARGAITSGCGSDDVIDSAVRAFCEPGDVVAYPWPTFGIVPTFARMNATRPVSVEHLPGQGLDIDGLLETRARLMYVCRPNNPTGESVPAADVIRLAASFGGVLLVDEAYAEFSDDDLIETAVGSRNVIVLRTLSKAWGMAGLRVGFAIGPPALINEIEKSRGPYKVNGPAELVGAAALREGQAWVDEKVEQVREIRARLTRALRDAGHSVLPSQANFVLVALGAKSTSASVARELRAAGVGVRPFEGLPGLGDCIRVTVGPWPMMEAFLNALGAVSATTAEDS